MAAAGGVVAAETLIPEKWGEPVVEIGYLPAHAQTSAGPQISGANSTPTQTACTTGGQPGTQHLINATYADATNGMSAGASANHTAVFQPSGASGTFTEPLTVTRITGTPAAGVVNYPICVRFSATDTAVVLTISLTNINGQTGNSTTLTINKPTITGQDEAASESAISGG